MDIVAQGLAAQALAKVGTNTNKISNLLSRTPVPDILSSFTVTPLPPVITTQSGLAGGSITPFKRVTASSPIFKVTGTLTQVWATDGSFYVPTDGAGTTALGKYITWEWMSDASVLEIPVYNFNLGADIFVDDRPIQSTRFSTGSTGGRFSIKLDWTSNSNPYKPRHYRISGVNMPFGGLYLNNNGSAWYPTGRNDRQVLAALGDSYTQGNGADGPARTWAAATAEYLGMDYYGDGLGGSGWNTAAPNDVLTRLSKGINALVRPPAIVLLALGYNDSAGNLTTMATNYDAAIASIRAAWPKTVIITVGPWTPLGSTPGLTNVKNTLQGRAIANNVLYADIDNMVNSENKTIYTNLVVNGGDDTHPVPLGQQYIGWRVGALVRSLLG